MKHLLAVLLSLLAATSVAVEKKTIFYAQKDTSMLYMDVYTPDHPSDYNKALFFVFGGGFKSGSKTDSINALYCRLMAERGFVVMAIDYRLGLKNAKDIGVLNPKPLIKAVDLAVEDLFTATDYAIKNRSELKVDTSLILVSGSSAGAITVLQADYEMANQREIAQSLPSGFRYAGVISFAGGVKSLKGKPRYLSTPAPTMFLHGEKDRLVPYKSIEFFNLGLFGSSALAGHFMKRDYPYFFISYQNMGHEVSYYPMPKTIDEICYFFDKFVLHRQPLQLHLRYRNMKVNKPLLDFDAGSYYH